MQRGASWLTWLEQSAVAVWARESIWAYPALEIGHIAGFSVLVGAAVLFDLRLLGVSRATLQPGQTAHAHQHHDMFEVFFVESGAGSITVGGAQHQLTRGVCLMVEPGELHEITNDSSADLVLLYFGLNA